MSDDPLESLLRAVELEPADDGARLVLADYLMERGDPRGELIRVQCALAIASGPDRAELAARERELLALRAPPEYTEVTHARGLCERATVRASWADPASQFLAGELVIGHLHLTHCAGNWERVGQLLGRLADKLRTVEITGVTSSWRNPEVDPGTGYDNIEEVDHRPWLTEMLEAAPRPRYFVKLVVPDGTAIPPHWQPATESGSRSPVS